MKCRSPFEAPVAFSGPRCLDSRDGPGRLQCVLAVVLATTTATSAVAATAPACSSVRAMRGVHDLELAEPLPEGTLVLGTGAAFFAADDVAMPGEHHRRLRWRGAVAGSPWGPLDLGLTWSAVSNSSRPAVATSAQTIGDPELSAKLSVALDSGVSLGALLQVLVPTSEGGSGLAASATTLTGKGLFTYRPIPALALTAEAGYRLDNTRNAISSSYTGSEAVLARFDTGVALTNAVVGGIGVIGVIQASPALSAAPFVEVVAAVAPGGAPEQNPVAANLGAKALLGESGLIELALGTSVRLAGAPSVTSRFAGLPPWDAFVLVTYHLGDDRPAPAAPEVPSCDELRACADRMACVGGECLPVQEVVKEVVKEVVRAPPTFVIAGVVTDATTKSPLPGATVRFSSNENVTLATGPGGEFLSWPIAVDDGLLKITVAAEGYGTAQQTLTKGPGGETKTFAVALLTTSRKAPGLVKGSLRDKGTGRPVAGTVSIPSAQKKVRTEDDGTFVIEVAPGRHHLVVAGPNVRSQEKQINIKAGQIVILNLDMTPR